MITFTETFSTLKIGGAVHIQAGHGIDSTTLENRDFRPSTHQAIGEDDITWEKEIP